MFSEEVVEEVKRLAAEGKLTHKEIAAKVGCSRAWVGLVLGTLKGSSRPKTRKRYARHKEKEDAPLSEKPLKLGPIGRCKHCGAKVHLPCLACASRTQR